MSTCACCPTVVQLSPEGFNALSPYRETDERAEFTAEHDTPRVCQACTRELVAAWAREMKRRNMPTNTPTPTGSPAGAGTAFVELLADVA